MKIKSKFIDNTLLSNYVAKYLHIIEEYDKVKMGNHPLFSKVMDFYRAHHLERRNFLKYYHRYKQSNSKFDLLPQKRGPKYKTRRPCGFIENKVIHLRLLGNNKYEINNILKPSLKKYTPSPSGIYNIIKRNNLNRLTPKMKQNKRKIIKEKIGQMGHIDIHHLSKGIIEGEHQRLYLLCIIDDYSRIAWTETLVKIRSIDVMFATLKCLNILHDQYEIKFDEILSDNGSEFKGDRETHPFERLLSELGIKHRYTRPYRPQTNGKVERLWRTIEDDLLESTTYTGLDNLKDELLQYMYYYNHERSHQGINGKKPVDLLPK